MVSAAHPAASTVDRYQSFHDADASEAKVKSQDTPGPQSHAQPRLHAGPQSYPGPQSRLGALVNPGTLKLPASQSEATATRLGLDRAFSSSDPEQQLRSLDRLFSGASTDARSIIRSDPRVQKLLYHSVSDAYKDTYQSSGAVAAAKRLRQLAEVLSPKLMAEVLAQSKSTIERIGHDVQGVASGMSEKAAIISDLSAATAKAAQDPANQQAVDQVAKSLITRLNDLGDSILGTLFVKPITSGNGLPLMTSVVSQLKDAGRMRAASMVATGANSALTQLKDQVGDDLNDYAKAREEQVYLLNNFGVLENPQDRIQGARTQQFWNKYQAEHPELAQTQKQMDASVMQYLKVSNDISNYSKLWEGLSAGVMQHNAGIAQDPNLMTAISASNDAPRWLADQIASGKSAHPLIAQTSLWNIPRELRTAYARSLNYSLAQHIETYRTAIDAGDFSKARQGVANIRQNMDRYGFSTQRKDNIGRMFDYVEEMIDAAADTSKNGPIRLQNALKEFNALQHHPTNGPSLDPSTLKGTALRALGIGLAFPIVAKQFMYQAQHFNDPDNTLGAFAQTVLNTGLSVHQLGHIGLGAANRFNMFDNAAKWAASWAHLAEHLVIFSAVTEAWLTKDYLFGKDKDVWMGLLHMTAAGSNAAVAAAYLKARPATGLLSQLASSLPVRFATLISRATLVGLVSSGAIYGLNEYRHYTDARKFETETTSRYLEALGFDRRVADQLRDQDSDGHSVGPVLYQLFADRGIDVQEVHDMHNFVRAMNRLGPERVQELVKAANNIWRDEAGNPVRSNPVSDGYMRLPADPESFVKSREAQQFGHTLRFNTSAQPPRWEDSATNSRFDPGTGRWVSMELEIPHIPDFKSFDPRTDLLYSEGKPTSRLPPTSLDGLRDWTIQQGYGLPMRLPAQH